MQHAIDFSQKLGQITMLTMVIYFLVGYYRYFYGIFLFSDTADMKITRSKMVVAKEKFTKICESDDENSLGLISPLN